MIGEIDLRNYFNFINGKTPDEIKEIIKTNHLIKEAVSKGLIAIFAKNDFSKTMNKLMKIQ